MSPSTNSHNIDDNNNNDKTSKKSKEFRSDDWSKIVSQIEYDDSNKAKTWYIC